MRVLVVEDELRMASVIRRSLAKEGLATDVTARGEESLEMAAAVDYDAIILDVMLPDMSGFDTCRSMRERGVWAPVLMLTARDAVADRVAGLDSGADDYLVKPFALAELHARLRSLARRGRPAGPDKNPEFPIAARLRALPHHSNRRATGAAVARKIAA